MKLPDRNLTEHGIDWLTEVQNNTKMKGILCLNVLFLLTALLPLDNHCFAQTDDNDHRCEAVLRQLFEEYQDLLTINDYETLYTDSVRGVIKKDYFKRTACLRNLDPKGVEAVFGKPDSYYSSPNSTMDKMFYSGYSDEEFSTSMVITVVKNQAREHRLLINPPMVKADGGSNH